jgi:hypothetical protein
MHLCGITRGPETRGPETRGRSRADRRRADGVERTGDAPTESSGPAPSRRRLMHLCLARTASTAVMHLCGITGLRVGSGLQALGQAPAARVCSRSRRDRTDEAGAARSPVRSSGGTDGDLVDARSPTPSSHDRIAAAHRRRSSVRSPDDLIDALGDGDVSSPGSPMRPIGPPQICRRGASRGRTAGQRGKGASRAMWGARAMGGRPGGSGRRWAAPGNAGRWPGQPDFGARRHRNRPL